MITKVYYKVNYSWTSLQRPPWGQKKVAIVERFKQESMYGLSAQKSGRYEKPGKRWSLWEWSFVEVRLHHKFRQLIFLQHAMDSMSHKWLLMDSYYNCDNYFMRKCDTINYICDSYIAKCDDYYKLRKYMISLIQIFVSFISNSISYWSPFSTMKFQSLRF